MVKIRTATEIIEDLIGELSERVNHSTTQVNTLLEIKKRNLSTKNNCEKIDNLIVKNNEYAVKYSQELANITMALSILRGFYKNDR